MPSGTADPSYLTRSLLNREVAWPDARGRPTAPPKEARIRLEDLLRGQELQHALFMEDASDSPAAYYTENPAHLADEFEALIKNLQALRQNRRVSNVVLRRGEAVLDVLIAGVQRAGEARRGELREDSESMSAFRDLVKAGEPEIGLACQHAQYYLYLYNTCTGAALQTLRDGVYEINAALDRQPPAASRG